MAVEVDPLAVLLSECHGIACHRQLMRTQRAMEFVMDQLGRDLDPTYATSKATYIFQRLE